MFKIQKKYDSVPSCYKKILSFLVVFTLLLTTYSSVVGAGILFNDSNVETEKEDILIESEDGETITKKFMDYDSEIDTSPPVSVEQSTNSLIEKLNEEQVSTKTFDLSVKLAEFLQKILERFPGLASIPFFKNLIDRLNDILNKYGESSIDESGTNDETSGDVPAEENDDVATGNQDEEMGENDEVENVDNEGTEDNRDTYPDDGYNNDGGTGDEGSAGVGETQSSTGSSEGGEEGNGSENTAPPTDGFNENTEYEDATILPDSGHIAICGNGYLEIDTIINVNDEFFVTLKGLLYIDTGIEFVNIYWNISEGYIEINATTLSSDGAPYFIFKDFLIEIKEINSDGLISISLGLLSIDATGHLFLSKSGKQGSVGYNGVFEFEDFEVNIYDLLFENLTISGSFNFSIGIGGNLLVSWDESGIIMDGRIEGHNSAKIILSDFYLHVDDLLSVEIGFLSLSGGLLVELEDEWVFVNISSLGLELEEASFSIPQISASIEYLKVEGNFTIDYKMNTTWENHYNSYLESNGWPTTTENWATLEINSDMYLNIKKPKVNGNTLIPNAEAGDLYFFLAQKKVVYVYIAENGSRMETPHNFLYVEVEVNFGISMGWLSGSGYLHACIWLDLERPNDPLMGLFAYVRGCFSINLGIWITFCGSIHIWMFGYLYILIAGWVSISPMSFNFFNLTIKTGSVTAWICLGMMGMSLCQIHGNARVWIHGLWVSGTPTGTNTHLLFFAKLIHIEVPHFDLNFQLYAMPDIMGGKITFIEGHLGGSLEINEISMILNHNGSEIIWLSMDSLFAKSFFTIELNEDNGLTFKTYEDTTEFVITNLDFLIFDPTGVPYTPAWWTYNYPFGKDVNDLWPYIWPGYFEPNAEAADSRIRVHVDEISLSVGYLEINTGRPGSDWPNVDEGDYFYLTVEGEAISFDVTNLNVEGTLNLSSKGLGRVNTSVSVDSISVDIGDFYLYAGTGYPIGVWTGGHYEEGFVNMSLLEVRGSGSISVEGVDVSGDIEGYPYAFSADELSLSVEGYLYLYGDGSVDAQCTGSLIFDNILFSMSGPNGSFDLDIAYSNFSIIDGILEIIPRGENETPLIIIDGQVEWDLDAHVDWHYQTEDFFGILENITTDGNISVNGTITIDMDMDGDFGNLTVNILFDGNIQIDQFYISGTIPDFGNMSLPFELNIENLEGTGMFEINVDLQDGSIELNNQIPDLTWDCFEIDIGEGLLAGEINYFFGDVTLDLVDNGDWHVHSRGGFNTTHGISFSSNGGVELLCNLEFDLSKLGIAQLRGLDLSLNRFYMEPNTDGTILIEFSDEGGIGISFVIVNGYGELTLSLEINLDEYDIPLLQILFGDQMSFDITLTGEAGMDFSFYFNPTLLKEEGVIAFFKDIVNQLYDHWKETGEIPIDLYLTKINGMSIIDLFRMLGIDIPDEWLEGEEDDSCFLEGTKIEMADGSLKNIEELKVGDIVASFDSVSNEFKTGTISRVFHHTPEEMTGFYLIINNDIRVTPNHPVFVDNEWIDAGELKIGDNFGENIVKTIQKVYDRVPTYNFEVEPYHTYNVVWGDDAKSIVHNANAEPQATFVKKFVSSDKKTCFLEDTKIQMADGSSKNIEDIKIGDEVSSFDIERCAWKSGIVSEVFHHSPSEMTDYYLVINNDLRVTPNHPVFVDNEWVDAGDLKVGDVFGGNTIVSIEKIFERVTTFNFEVEPCHTYNIIWGESSESIVHNAANTEIGNSVSTTAKSVTSDKYIVKADSGLKTDLELSSEKLKVESKIFKLVPKNYVVDGKEIALEKEYSIVIKETGKYDIKCNDVVIQGDLEFAEVVTYVETNIITSDSDGNDNGGNNNDDDCCFPAGTLISMADGSAKSIEHVKVGEYVLSYNTKDHELTTCKVLETVSPMRKGVYSINDGLVRPTDDHPLYVMKSDGVTGWAAINPDHAEKGYGMTPMKLEIGDSMFTKEEKWIKIQSIEYQEGSIQTYNLEDVSGKSTFFANEILVHNTAVCSNSTQSSSTTTTTTQTDTNDEDDQDDETNNNNMFMIASSDYDPHTGATDTLYDTSYEKLDVNIEFDGSKSYIPTETTGTDEGTGEDTAENNGENYDNYGFIYGTKIAVANIETADYKVNKVSESKESYYYKEISLDDKNVNNDNDKFYFKNIEGIRAGDWVKSYDEKTHTFVNARVLQVQRHAIKDCYLLIKLQYDTVESQPDEEDIVIDREILKEIPLDYSYDRQSIETDGVSPTDMYGLWLGVASNQKIYVIKETNENEIDYQCISASEVKQGDRVLTVDGIATVASVEQVGTPGIATYTYSIDTAAYDKYVANSIVVSDTQISIVDETGTNGGSQTSNDAQGSTNVDSGTNDEVDRTYLWDYGDGNVGTGENPTHVYDPVSDFVKSNYGIARGTEIAVTYKIESAALDDLTRVTDDRDIARLDFSDVNVIPKDTNSGKTVKNVDNEGTEDNQDTYPDDGYNNDGGTGDEGSAGVGETQSNTGSSDGGEEGSGSENTAPPTDGFNKQFFYPVEMLRVGDFVVSYDQQKQEITNNRVIGITPHIVNEYYINITLKFNKESIYLNPNVMTSISNLYSPLSIRTETNDECILLVSPDQLVCRNGEFTAAKEVRMDDELTTILGENVLVVSVEEVIEEIVIYDVDVETNHNFYAEGILVADKNANKIESPENTVNPDDGACFLEGTTVLMANGTYRYIEEIKTGEYVESYNPVAGVLTNSKVINIFSHDENQIDDYYLIITYQYSDKTSIGTNIEAQLKVTPNHPIPIGTLGYSVDDSINRRYSLVSAKEIKIGDRLITNTGEQATVTSVDFVKILEEKINVYNLGIETYHNYFANGVLVSDKKVSIGTIYDINLKEKQQAQDIKVFDDIRNLYGSLESATPVSNEIEIAPSSSVIDSVAYNVNYDGSVTVKYDVILYIIDRDKDGNLVGFGRDVTQVEMELPDNYLPNILRSSTSIRDTNTIYSNLYNSILSLKLF